MRKKQLKEIVEITLGSNPNGLNENGEFEFFNAGLKSSGFTTASNRTKDSITTPARGKGGTGSLVYHTKDYWLGPLAYSLKSLDETELSNKYLFYWLEEKKAIDKILRGEPIPSVNKKDLEKIVINYPEISRQEEVIKILDCFSQLLTTLEAELKLRKLQYDFYAELIFKKLSKAYPTVKLKKIVDLNKGLVFHKLHEDQNGNTQNIKVLNAGNIDLYGIHDLNSIEEVKVDVPIKEKSWLKRGDVLINTVSGSSEHVGKVALINEDLNITFSGFMADLRSKELEFLFHYLNSPIFKNYVKKIIGQMVLKKLLARQILDYKIPLVPNEEQNEVIKPLRDLFSLMQLIKQEITLTEKQFSFYKSQLFKDIDRI